MKPDDFDLHRDCVGGGKTLSMTYEAYRYFLNGYTIYSNYHLNFPHKKLTKRVFDGMIGDNAQLQNAVLCLDEVHIWLDSRSSMMKKNKVITYFILQTRKRNVRLLCTTQHMHQIDKRLRDTIDVLVFCRNITNKTSTVKDPSHPVYIMQERIYQWAKMPAQKRVIHANPLFDLFDTTEIIEFEDTED